MFDSNSSSSSSNPGDPFRLNGVRIEDYSLYHMRLESLLNTKTVCIEEAKDVEHSKADVDDKTKKLRV